MDWGGHYRNDEVNKLPWIDTLKGIAIIGTCMVHFYQTTSGLPQVVRRICSYGYLGVEVFYIVNSFLLCRKFLDDKFDHINPVRILIYNILRILPLYYLHLPFLFREHNWSLSVDEYISQFLFVGWANPNWHHYNGWVMTIVLGWIYFLVVRRGLKSLTGTISVFAVTTVLGEIFYMYAWKYLPQLHVDKEYIGIWVSQIMRVISSFTAGFILYKVYEGLQKNKVNNKRIGIVLLLIAVMYLYIFFDQQQKISNMNFNCIIVLIFISQYLYPVKLLSNIILRTFGKYSWGIYMFHLYIFEWIKKISGFDGWTLVIVSLFSCLCFSIIASRIIETPIRNRIKKIIEVQI